MSDAPLDVVVLCGGISHERDVSLRSGRRVADGLRRRGHRVTILDPDAGVLGSLRERRPDAVWPALHGSSGEDGALRALLALLDVPFVGARSDAASLAWSKPTAKALAVRAGVATAPSVTLPREALRELGAPAVLELLGERIGSPFVVKPARGGSAHGVTIVDDPAQLPRAMVDAYTYGDVALVESRLVGTEIAITVLDTGDGPRALPAVEIVPRSGAYGFDARYTAGETTFFTPARLDDAAAEKAARSALAVWDALGLRHLARLDFIVGESGEPTFLEANTMPGLTETSLTPLALRAASLDEGDVFSALAARAVVDDRKG